MPSAGSLHEKSLRDTLQPRLQVGSSYTPSSNSRDAAPRPDGVETSLAKAKTKGKGGRDPREYRHNHRASCVTRRLPACNEPVPNPSSLVLVLHCAAWLVTIIGIRDERRETMKAQVEMQSQPGWRRPKTRHCRRDISTCIEAHASRLISLTPAIQLSTCQKNGCHRPDPSGARRTRGAVIAVVPASLRRATGRPGGRLANGAYCLAKGGKNERCDGSRIDKSLPLPAHTPPPSEQVGDVWFVRGRTENKNWMPEAAKTGRTPPSD